MRVITLIDEAGRPVCESCAVADRTLSRLRGLLGRRSFGRGEGLLIEPGWTVHTWFLHFPIDVVFLDRDLRVLEIVGEVAPWHAAVRRGAHAVLELPAGTAARRRLTPGMRLAWGLPPAPA